MSTVLGGNVVWMGDAVEQRLRELLPRVPHGMELGIIAMQSVSVTEAINGFVVNLVQAVAIVVVVSCSPWVCGAASSSGSSCS